MSSSSANKNSDFGRHHKMAGDHQRRAERHGDPAPEPTVGDQPAEDRREIHEAGVKPIDVRGQRLRAERAGQRLERGFQRAEANDLSGALGLQQIIDDVENEQRAHAVIGKAFPHLRREQEGEALGMAEPFGCWRGAVECLAFSSWEE